MRKLFCAIAALVMSAAFLFVAMPAQAATILCPGTNLAMDISYDFNAGNPYGETINAQASDKLSIIQPYNAVTFDGSSAIFNNFGLLSSKPFADQNPGTRSFAFCVLWWNDPTDPDGHNLVQINNNPGSTGTNAHVKIMPGYCLFIPSNDNTKKASVVTHGAGVAGWHTESCIRRGDTFYSYLDGVLQEQVTVTGFGPIDLDGSDSLCAGSKCTNGTNPIDSNDMWKGKIAYVRFGIN
jgi:hypothetical protein